MATAKPKSTKTTSPMIAELYRPGVLEKGLQVLAKEQDEAAVKKDAPAPESAADEYLRLQSAKIVADALFEVADKKMKAEADAKAEEPKLRASKAFAQAFHAWLAAKAGKEDPLLEDDEQPELFRAESDAERGLHHALSLSGSSLAEAGGV
jgi:hypothetical protein